MEVEDQWKLQLAEDLDSLKPAQRLRPELAEDLDSLKPVQPPNLVEDLDSLKLDQEGVPAQTPFPSVRIRMLRQPLEPKEDLQDKFADLTGSNAPGVHGLIPPSELRTPTIG